MEDMRRQPAGFGWEGGGLHGGDSMVKKGKRPGAAVENALFPWGTVLCGWMLVKRGKEERFI